MQLLCKTAWGVLEKLNIALAYDSTVPPQRIEKQTPSTHACTLVPVSISHSSQKVETAPTPTKG